jgi:hypothetical protein
MTYVEVTFLSASVLTAASDKHNLRRRDWRRLRRAKKPAVPSVGSDAWRGTTCTSPQTVNYHGLRRYPRRAADARNRHNTIELCPSSATERSRTQRNEAVQ